MSKIEKYSFSRLTAFEQCPYQYWLTYLANEDGTVNRGEDNAFAQYGSFVHGLLDKFEGGELRTWEMLGAYQDGYMDAVTLDFPQNAFADLSSSYYTDGEEFFVDFDGFGESKILEHESYFETPVDDFVVCGYVDLVLQEPDGRLTVRDWKSASSIPKNSPKKRQLYTYCSYVKEKYGRYPDNLEFYLFRKQKKVSFQFKQKDYDETQQWIRDTVAKIRSCKDWSIHCDEFYCENLCGHRNACGINDLI